jgi:hypothetical protein
MSDEQDQILDTMRFLVRHQHSVVRTILAVWLAVLVAIAWLLKNGPLEINGIDAVTIAAVAGAVTALAALVPAWRLCRLYRQTWKAAAEQLGLSRRESRASKWRNAGRGALFITLAGLAFWCGLSALLVTGHIDTSKVAADVKANMTATAEVVETPDQNEPVP